MRKSWLFILSFFITVNTFAQEKFWKFESELTAPKNNLPQSIIPQAYRTISLQFDLYKTFLSTSPKEALVKLNQGLEISLPYPDNTFKRFKIVETEMMEDELATQFPNVKTYFGQGIDDPSATVRIDYTNLGFHAFVISPVGNLFIDPYQKGNNNLYITYFSKDYENLIKAKVSCKTANPIKSKLQLPLNTPLSGGCIGTQLLTYRLALSCTGEYAVAVCPAGNVTVANTLSAMVTTINRVNGIYQTELDIKLKLVAANASIVYTNPATDPYSGNIDGATLINESQANITAVIGSVAFDIGHTFSTGAGGLAIPGVVCNSSAKAKGVTGLGNPTGDAYDVDYVAHEIGHQFGASHTFESETGACSGVSRVQSSAFEPGGGTSIMSYSGLCGSDDIQPNSNAYFHTRTFDEIVSYTTTGTGSTCPVVTGTGNNPPVIIMPLSAIKIPKGTPFTLTGNATDLDGDALTYSWEEWDLSGQNTGSAWNSGATSSTAPLFKARIPKVSASRTFPDIAVILANYPSSPSATMNGLKGETLPQVARDIKFRLIARDNKPYGGGVATGGNGCSSTQVFKVVVTDDGPFVVTSPNTAVNWPGGSTQTVTWNVANTNNATGINAQNVDILMSTDGGFTYPVNILSGVTNDGSQNITVPNIATNSTVRLMVKASGSIFFDISNVNFTITNNSVLPVSLLDFTARPFNAKIVLTWTTSSEVNNKGFEIFRSVGNGNNFVKIGFVAATGSINSKREYTWNDSSIQKGVEYFYRLRQIDLSNNFLYSSIERATINIESRLLLSVHPQPLYNAGDLYVSGIEKENFTIVITDVTGRTILKQEIKNSDESRIIPIDLSHKSSSIYYIKVYQKSNEKTVRVVKLSAQ